MMNTWILRNICVSLAVFCLAASASAAPFTSPRGYSISVPPGWHVQAALTAGDDAEIVVNQKVMVGRTPTLAALSIRFQPVSAPLTAANLRAFNDGIVSALRDRFPDLKVLSQTPSTLGGSPDLDSVFRGTVHGVPVRFHEVLVARPGTAAVFSSICPVQTLPKYAGAFAQMLASVHWKS